MAEIAGLGMVFTCVPTYFNAWLAGNAVDVGLPYAVLTLFLFYINHLFFCYPQLQTYKP